MADEPGSEDAGAEETPVADDPGETRVAIACQGGGSHTAFTAGALKSLLADDDTNVVGLSGTSGGGICATAAWYGLLAPDETPGGVLDAVWDDIAARSPIDRATNAWTVWGSAIEASGYPTPAISPYLNPAAALGQRRLERALTDNIDFERFPDLATTDSPRLAVGTVDVDAGEFETFVDADVTADAVLASTAIPELFPGVEIDGHVHWDGIFSHNPPLNELMYVDRERKPQELWIVQINPDGTSETPTSLREIQDRRNELAGNLSLNQQLHFIERVNDWIDAGHLPRSDFQRVKLRRIELDRDLTYATKLNRDAAFLDDLRELGVDAAAEFCDRRQSGDVDEHFHVDATSVHDAHADDD